MTRKLFCELFSRRKSRFLAIGVAVILTLGLSRTGLAWTFLGNFNPTTAWWGPNEGEKYGQIVDDGGINRYIDVDAESIWYAEDRLAEL
jgi:hypothetical protein